MDDFTRHEALHTTHILRDAVYNNLIEHSYANSGVNEKFNEALTVAFDALCDAYQLCNEENEE